ncbi:MAG: 50S ribosomal protein L30 [Rhodospirillaceae bacterium]|nr:50S ribosomal protein L30 [Rhodospirillaceae bacterium]
MAQNEVGRLRVTQIGSGIGRPKDQKATLVGLGLNKLNRTRVLDNSPSIRGMITKVQHLVHVEIVE